MSDTVDDEPADCGPVKVVYSRDELLDSARVFWDRNIRGGAFSPTEKLSSYGMLVLFVDGLFSRRYDPLPRDGEEG